MNLPATKKSLFVICFLLLYAFTLSAQNHTIDSLRLCYNSQTKENRTKVDVTNELAEALCPYSLQEAQQLAAEAEKLAESLHYTTGKAKSIWVSGQVEFSRDREKSMRLFGAALQLAESCNDTEGKCACLRSMGNMYSVLGNLEKSDSCFYQIKQIDLKNKSKKQMADALLGIGRNETKRGNTDTAIKILEEAVVDCRQTNDDAILAKIYSSLGYIYLLQGNQPKALDCYLQALNIYEKREDKKDILSALTNIGAIRIAQKEYLNAIEIQEEVYRVAESLQDTVKMAIALSNTGTTYMHIKEPEKGLEYLKRALPYVGNNIDLKIMILQSLASVYADDGHFREAQQLLDEAMQLNGQVKSLSISISINNALGELNLKQKKYGAAVEYGEQALKASEKTGIIGTTTSAHKLLADAYAAMGNYKNAYHHSVAYKTLSDSIFNQSNVREIARLESRYQYEKEKQQFETEKEKNELIIANQKRVISLVIAIALLVGILLFSLFWATKLKKDVLKIQIAQHNRDIEYSQQELATAALKLVQTAEGDSHCIKQLEELEENTEQGNRLRVRSLINYYRRKNDVANWKEFETLFTKVSPAFLDKLNRLYPDLTANERKLCIFLKLNMSNKDIAKITFQSEEALKKARTRLRKKLGISRDENLVAVIQKI